MTGVRCILRGIREQGQDTGGRLVVSSKPSCLISGCPQTGNFMGNMTIEQWIIG